MKNYEIYSANQGLGSLIDEPLKGKLKFKVFKIKSKLEESVQVIALSLEGTEDEDERKEILNQEQDVHIEKLTEEDLEDLALSVKQLSKLQFIIDMESDEKRG